MSDLLSQHDVLFADLDGTLYRGPVAVPGAVEAVRGAAARGVRTVYVTNNASRRPVEVAAHLAELGFAATADDVVGSSQAAATMLAQRLPAGAPVLVVGTEALAEEITLAGLAVTRDADEAAAVVQGHSPDTGWRDLAEATVALRAGALWVACNLDPTLPTERGPLPGNGSMVAALRTASAREPLVAGKPAPAMLLDAVRRTGAQRALMIGDRLDTDVEGGRAAGIVTLLVLTGVSDAVELIAAAPALRPDYIGADLGALLVDAADLAPGPRPGWTVRITGRGALTLGTDGSRGEMYGTRGRDSARSTNSAPRLDPIDALRALCAAHWAAGGGAAKVTAEDAVAARALWELGLSSNCRNSSERDSGDPTGGDPTDPSGGDRGQSSSNPSRGDPTSGSSSTGPCSGSGHDGGVGASTTVVPVETPGVHR